MTRRILALHKLKHPRRIDGTFKVSQRGKYKAQGRWMLVDEAEHWFPSKAEADRCEQLLELRNRGRITDLELQPRFPMDVKGVRVCTYVADFRYKKIIEGRMGGTVIIEEVKGMLTKEYIIKRKLMAALYPDVRISELKVPKRGGVERMRWLTADEIYTIPPTER